MPTPGHKKIGWGRAQKQRVILTTWDLKTTVPYSGTIVLVKHRLCQVKVSIDKIDNFCYSVSQRS